MLFANLLFIIFINILHSIDVNKNNSITCYVEQCDNITLVISYDEITNSFYNSKELNYCETYIPLTNHICYLIDGKLRLNPSISIDKFKILFELSLIMDFIILLIFWTSGSAYFYVDRKRNEVLNKHLQI